MKSAARQSLGPDLPKIIRSVLENTNSDITIGTALYLGTRTIGMSSENIRMYQIPTSPMGNFVKPDGQGIADMLTEIYSMDAVIIETSDSDESE
jgi:hypothetical protein